MKGFNFEPEYRRRIREKAEEYKKKANDERNRATQSANVHEIVLAIKAIDQKYDCERHQQHARHKWDRFWEVMGVIGLWLAAGVGVAAICIGTRDASEQRTVMQGQLVAQDRPWLYIVGDIDISQYRVPKYNIIN